MLVGKGIGNALKVFKERGMLGKNKFYGRNKDQTSEDILKGFGDTNNQENDRVKLVHIDKSGHILT